MVQNFTVVFAVVLIGYYALSRSNQYKERLLTATNYAILYESAILGISIFASFWLIALGIKFSLLECPYIAGSGQVKCTFDRFYPLPFSDILIASVAAAWLSKYVDNRILTENELGEQIARKSGLIANIVLDALIAKHLVQITTLRGKVYIGWVMLGPGLSRTGTLADIAVVPLYSGHRDEKTQLVVRDIDYSQALYEYAKLIKAEESEVDELSPQHPDMSVMIPMGEIALIRRHTESLTESFIAIE